MNTPQAHRRVWLITGHSAEQSSVSADLYRGLPAHVLDEIERMWAGARETAATEREAAGLNPLEHDHWCWRNKAVSVEEGRHMLIAIESEGRWQGAMAVARLVRSGRLGGGSVVYVDYIEAAPWNLKSPLAAARFKGVGIALLADAVRLSIETGLDGRVGLHSLPQAEPFYTRCGMTRVGEDPDYYGLPYYEYTGPQSAAWLASLEESA